MAKTPTYIRKLKNLDLRTYRELEIAVGRKTVTEKLVAELLSTHLPADFDPDFKEDRDLAKALTQALKDKVVAFGTDGETTGKVPKGYPHYIVDLDCEDTIVAFMKHKIAFCINEELDGYY